MKRLYMVGAATALILLVSPATTRAATCTVDGDVTIDAWDQYYCDTSFANCSGWQEVDLDTQTRPMVRMHVVLEQSPGGNVLAEGWTDTAGHYSLSFTSSSCTQVSFKVRWRFKYVNTGSPQAPQAGRFRVSRWNGNTWSVLQYPARTFGSAFCGSPSTHCTVNQHFNRVDPPTDNQKHGNVYFTAHSMIDRVRLWSSRLDVQFSDPDESNDGTGMLRMYHDPGYDDPAKFSGDAWMVYLDWNKAYITGFHTRHEIGHAVNHAMHLRERNGWCVTYLMNWNSPFNGHSFDTCEYASTATVEGLAHFFAVRSIVTDSGNEAWACDCSDPVDMDICSGTRAVALADPDRIIACPGQGASENFVGIGDNFSTTHCARLMEGSTCSCPDVSPANGYCDNSDPSVPAPGVPQMCPDVDSNNECDNLAYLGQFNETQVARFMWDMIDANNEGGLDDTQRAMSDLVIDLQNMPCDEDVGGVDGTCNEPDYQPGVPGGYCKPIEDSDVFDPADPMQSTRNAYNVWDLAELIPGDQYYESALNCVLGASD